MARFEVNFEFMFVAEELGDSGSDSFLLFLKCSFELMFEDSNNNIEPGSHLRTQKLMFVLLQLNFLFVVLDFLVVVKYFYWVVFSHF